MLPHFPGGLCKPSEGIVHEEEHWRGLSTAPGRPRPSCRPLCEMGGHRRCGRPPGGWDPSAAQLGCCRGWVGGQVTAAPRPRHRWGAGPRDPWAESCTLGRESGWMGGPMQAAGAPEALCQLSTENPFSSPLGSNFKT